MRRQSRVGRCIHVICLVACAGIIVGVVLGSARADRIDEYVTRQLKARNIPGVSLAVVRSGRVIRAGGYGTASLELDVPARASTVYEIGSISKQFTAEAVMLLVEEGKVALDERAGHRMVGAEGCAGQRCRNVG